MYINKLDDIVNESNNAYYSKIKMKPADLNSGICTVFGMDNNKKLLNLK